PDLRAAIDMARRGTGAIHREGLRKVNFDIVPVNTPPDRERLFLVLFESTQSAPAEAAASPEDAEDQAGPEGAALKRELAAAKEHLQVLMDERQASEEELRSANEEILSSNEELQSTNEELETSQEELQSTNEELTTVNDELQLRNSELSQLSNDLSNLLNSVNIPIVMLGNDLNIRRFTPMAGRVLNLRSGDIGRPIQEIQSYLDAPNLTKLLTEVVTDLIPKEIEVRDRGGSWFALRLR